MTTGPSFYRVISDLQAAPVNDHLFHGYESRQDFVQALRRLIDRWKGRVGEAVEERHDFLLLRFHDTPGGMPDEEWLPKYLLEQVPPPEYMRCLVTDSSEELRRELDLAFGFD